jgi:hypothetical protein
MNLWLRIPHVSTRFNNCSLYLIESKDGILGGEPGPEPDSDVSAKPPGIWYLHLIHQSQVTLNHVEPY